MNEKGFDPIKLAEKLRPRMIDLKKKKVLLSRLSGTVQAKDIARHTSVLQDFFRTKLYIKPEQWKQFKEPFQGQPAGIACRKLKIPRIDCNAAFTFQVNGCNSRCWFCYVDDANNSANLGCGRLFTAEEILINFLVASLTESKKYFGPEYPGINVIRMTGGEITLIPEIVPWMIGALEKYNLQDHIYLWVDTNLLTGDFFWRYLTKEQIEKIKSFRNIGFVGCYKGINKTSFHENTGGIDPEFFEDQFRMHKRFVEMGVDFYTYLVPTVSSTRNLEAEIALFMSRIQETAGHYAPLKLSVIEIHKYEPAKVRLTPKREKALKIQYKLMEAWEKELQRRFSWRELCIEPHEVPTGV